MNPQKLANLETRMGWYQQQYKSWIKQSATFFLLVALVTCGLYSLVIYLIPTFGFSPDENAKYLIPIIGLALFLFGNGTVNPYPEKPTQMDVLNDQALRLAHGMSDEVEG